jgi:hypothetical protein
MAAHSESNSTTCDPHLVLCIFLLIILSQTFNRLLCLMRFEFTCHEMFRIYLMPQMNLLATNITSECYQRTYAFECTRTRKLGNCATNVGEVGNEFVAKIFLDRIAQQF